MKAYELLFFVAPNTDEETRAGVMKRIDVAITAEGFVAPTISDETRLAVMKRIEATIAEGEGKIDNVEDWGKRKLAFEIDDLTEGDYTLINFHADPQQIAELDRVLRINDAVKRHMVVCRSDRD